ncbi:MAG: hypothetical protein ABGZ17_16880 [Planctomycetaceae bacterium]
MLGGRARQQFVAYGYGMIFRKCDDLPAVYEDEAAQIVDVPRLSTRLARRRECDLE